MPHRTSRRPAALCMTSAHGHTCAPAALNYFAAEVLPRLHPALPRFDFVVPSKMRIPPRMRDHRGLVDQPGYARAFSYLGFTVDPEEQGEADKWRVASFDAAAFRTALEHVRGVGDGTPAAASQPPQQRLMLHLPNPDRAPSGGGGSGGGGSGGGGGTHGSGGSSSQLGVPAEPLPPRGDRAAVAASSSPASSIASTLAAGACAATGAAAAAQAPSKSGVIFDPRWLAMRAAAAAADNTADGGGAASTARPVVSNGPRPPPR
eukprot:7167858-Prymnesium_polylepis.1